MNHISTIQSRLVDLARGFKEVEATVRKEGDAEGAQCLAKLAERHMAAARAVALMSSPAATTGQRRLIFGEYYEELVFTASFLTVWWASLSTPFALRARLRALAEQAETLCDDVQKASAELPPIPAEQLN